MPAAITILNQCEQQVEVLIQDCTGSQTKVLVDPGAQLTSDVNSGDVYIKLFTPGAKSGGIGFGMSLMSADVTTSTVTQPHKSVL